jgi:hypothetical protein
MVSGGDLQGLSLAREREYIHVPLILYIGAQGSQTYLLIWLDSVFFSSELWTSIQERKSKKVRIKCSSLAELSAGTNKLEPSASGMAFFYFKTYIFLFFLPSYSFDFSKRISGRGSRQLPFDLTEFKYFRSTRFVVQFWLQSFSFPIYRLVQL